MHFSYVFILQFLVQLYMCRKIISFIIRSFVVYYIYSSVQTVQTCLTAWSCKTKQLDMHGTYNVKLKTDASYNLNPNCCM